MYKAGMRALYILPEPKEFRPNTMRTHMHPNYLTDEFFELCKYAIDYAESKGIAMWLYDEGGWPSGCACGQITKKYPDTTAKTIIETDDGYSYVSPNNVTDVLDNRVMDEFIENTYEGYKRCLGDDFGKKATAIFTDEPTMQYPYYIKDTNDFEKATGYSFEKYIPVLFGHSVDEYDKKFKISYIDYASRKFEEKYMKRLHKWCRDNNICFTGHMDGDHVLSDYGKQAGNALRHLRHMDIPGVDAILRQIYPGNESNTFFPRIASSASNQTGGHLALTESFAVYGNGLTFNDMRYVANYQFVRGINILNLMSVTSGRDRCLSSQCRPHFVPQLPTNEYMPVFNGYISRMMYLCQLGEVCVDTALYMPIRDAWVGNTVAEESYTALGKALESNQIYFDIIDDDFLIECKNENGKLKMGNAEYSAVYIPETEYITKEAQITLSDFESRGGKVYRGCRVHTDGVVKCDNPHIRVMKKTAGKDILYFLFNENTGTEKFNVQFTESKNGYTLNCINGTIEPLADCFKLESGETAVVIFTDKALKTSQTPKLSNYIEITDFEKTVEMVLSYDGEKYVKSGNIPDNALFSGTVKYTATFTGDNYRAIELSGVCDCAKVVINGNEIGKTIMSPHTLKINSECLKSNNLLEIYVSNTSANAYVTADYSNADPVAVGPYHAITLEFEKERPELGLGSVKLY